jgi:uncharacterized membrane protein YbhN (UPF0104 family)
VIKFILKCIISISILIYIFSILDFHLLREGIHKISTQTLLIAGFFCFLSILFQTARWCFMTKEHLSGTYFQQAILFWKAGFFNLITPASLGGDIYRVASSRDNNKSSITLGLIIRERLIGLLGICFTYLLFFEIYRLKKYAYLQLPSFFFTTALLCCLAMISLLILQSGLPLLAKIASSFFRKSWSDKISAFSHSVRYKSIFEYFLLSLFTLLSLISWTLVYYLLSKDLSYPTMAFEKVGLISIMTEVVRWIPISVQGLGVREGFSGYAFTLLGQPIEVGFLIAGIAYCINSFILLFIGLLSFLSSNTLNKSYKPYSLEVKDFS